MNDLHRTLKLKLNKNGQLKEADRFVSLAIELLFIEINE